ncbi:tetratricopeptide repeat protein, partial [Candidatus Microgenomates bacterium]|nr:tetratricopeptide repeat protein [Candidatus Microgenomates bacterium]
MKNYLLIGISFLLLTFFCYHNILNNKLFYDDEELIYKNAYVADLRYFPKYFSENMVAGAGKTSNMYRPVLLLSFAIDHAIWGNNPIGYHLTSILLHAANAFLIFLLIQRLFQRKILAFFTALLFIIHPIQTEAVAYASGRTDLLCSFFILLSLLFFLKKNILPAAVFFILAILSKETAIILPFLLILISLKLPAIIALFFSIDFVYLILRLTTLNFGNTLNFYQTGNLYSQNLFVRLLTFPSAFFQYLQLLIFPKELIFARNMTYVTSITNPAVIMFLLITIGLFLLINKTKNKILLFSAGWFFLTILPVSGIIPINSIAAEHYLYLPSIGLFFLVASIFFFIWQKFSSHNHRTILSVICLTVFGLLIVRTIARNNDWHDPITFYTRSLAQSPWHLPMRHNLAMAYAENRQTDLAIAEYKNLIALSDIYPNTHHNLANIYKEQGKYQEAEEEYQKAIVLDQNFIFSYYALADL